LNPDEAIAAGWLRPDSWTTRGLAVMLHYGLRRATTIVALDRFMARRIEEKGIPADKIVTLSPWSHDRMVRYDTEGRTRFRKEHGLDSGYVVMYSGNHSPCHPLTTLLEAARALRECDDIRFCFAGGGSEFDTVKQYARCHDLKNITTIPYQPLTELSALLSSADLHVVIMGDPFVGLVHPCKVYNIRALGIPFLYIGPAKSHISELAPAFAARHGDVAGVAGQIERGAASRISRTSPPDRPFHSHKVLVGRMVATLERTGLAPQVLRPAMARLEHTARGGTRG
jgi:glycosyltransferase involved in cell wall biosynthesis